MTIYKYPLKLAGMPEEIFLPDLATIIHVGNQEGVPVLWAIVDPALITVGRTFLVIGTGHDLLEGYRHIGTTQPGPFVWHVFEKE